MNKAAFRFLALPCLMAGFLSAQKPKPFGPKPSPAPDPKLVSPGVSTSKISKRTSTTCNSNSATCIPKSKSMWRGQRMRLKKLLPTRNGDST